MAAEIRTQAGEKGTREPSISRRRLANLLSGTSLPETFAELPVLVFDTKDRLIQPVRVLYNLGDVDSW